MEDRSSKGRITRPLRREWVQERRLLEIPSELPTGRQEAPKIPSTREIQSVALSLGPMQIVD